MHASVRLPPPLSAAGLQLSPCFWSCVVGGGPSRLPMLLLLLGWWRLQGEFGNLDRPTLTSRLSEKCKRSVAGVKDGGRGCARLCWMKGRERGESECNHWVRIFWSSTRSLPPTLYDSTALRWRLLLFPGRWQGGKGRDGTIRAKQGREAVQKVSRSLVFFCSMRQELHHVNTLFHSPAIVHSHRGIGTLILTLRAHFLS